MKPRDYQQAAVNSLFSYFERSTGNPIIALPTGTGKSIIIAAFIREALERYPKTRIMKLTHVKELIEQNLDKLLRYWPLAPAGIYSSGLGRKELGFPIIFGGIATVVRSDPAKFGRIDLLIIDECHLVSAKQNSMYQKVISGLKEVNPQLKVIGLTATHYRLGSGSLIDNEEDSLFTDACFDMTRLDAFNWFLNEGYLSHLIPKPTTLKIDVSEVRIRGGEFKQDELQEAVDREGITRAAVVEMASLGKERKHWLIFAAGIQHAVHVAEMLEEHGIKSTVVHSKMPTKDRDKAISGFVNGKYRAIVNNGILTTGFDFPGIDLIGVLRHTMSASLWVQMLGRGTRPVYEPGIDISTKEGRLAAIQAGPKQNCLVLDFARNTIRLGPINDPVLPNKKGKGRLAGAAPVKICDACGTYVHSSARVCPVCGYEFPAPIHIQQEASSAELIAKNRPQKDRYRFSIAQVDKTTIEIHRKAEKPPSLKVTYYCGLSRYQEWVCLEHGGYATKKARDWWRRRLLDWHDEPPTTTAEAYTKLDSLRVPTHLFIRHNPRGYDEVNGYSFDQQTPIIWQSIIDAQSGGA